LYLWGTPTPGEDDVIECLNEVGPGEVALVEILSEADEEPVDIISAAVGRNHVAVVTDAGQLFVIGDNGNGQLGLGRGQSFVEDWTRVHPLNGLRRVAAGPKATFAFAA
jgi:alpha-tubulin suppressor-like RCC1 family protein